MYHSARGRGDGSKAMLDALGSKGSGLHEMANLARRPRGSPTDGRRVRRVRGGRARFRAKDVMAARYGGGVLIERESRKTPFREGNSLDGPPLVAERGEQAAISICRE